MLSADLNNLAEGVQKHIDHHVAGDDDISIRFLRGVIANLNGCMDQARALEAQMAPGSPAPGNVTVLAAKREARR